MLAGKGGCFGSCLFFAVQCLCENHPSDLHAYADVNAAATSVFYRDCTLCVSSSLHHEARAAHWAP